MARTDLNRPGSERLDENEAETRRQADHGDQRQLLRREQQSLCGESPSPSCYSLTDFIQDEKNLRLFEGLEEFEKFKSEMLKGKTNKKLLKTFSPSGSLGEKWQRSVEGKDGD